MHWVKRGEHTPKYTLRAGKGGPGTDATGYVPGTLMNLWVTTMDYDWKYKGFFSTAVDARGRSVGAVQQTHATPRHPLPTGCHPLPCPALGASAHAWKCSSACGGRSCSLRHRAQGTGRRVQAHVAGQHARAESGWGQGWGVGQPCAACFCPP